MENLKKAVAVAVIVIGLLTVQALPAGASTGMSPAVANGVHAAQPQVIIPEWYQFCKDRRPVGITAANVGYMNAVSARDGVTCKYWVMPYRAGFPSTTLRYFSWQTVCTQLGYKTTYWDRGYPWCKR